MGKAEGNIISEKSFGFSVRIIKLYKYLSEEKKEFVLSKQILRCGTSIGANIEESTEAQTKKDFITKLYIALKEAAETRYWIKLLVETEYLEYKVGNSLLTDLNEIIRLLNTSIKTAKNNLNIADKK